MTTQASPLEYEELIRDSISMRFLILRKHLIGIKKQDLEKKYNLKRYLIDNIEKNKISNIPNSILSEVHNAFVKEAKERNLSYNLEEDFFISGKGEIPKIYFDSIYDLYLKQDDVDESALKDVELINLKHKNSEILMIQDNNNKPLFSIGDYVLYMWKDVKDLNYFIKVPCVVKIDKKLSVKFCTTLKNGKVIVENFSNPSRQKIVVDKIAPIIHIRLTQRYRTLNLS